MASYRGNSQQMQQFIDKCIQDLTKLLWPGYKQSGTFSLGFDGGSKQDLYKDLVRALETQRNLQDMEREWRSWLQRHGFTEELLQNAKTQTSQDLEQRQGQTQLGSYPPSYQQQLQPLPQDSQQPESWQPQSYLQHTQQLSQEQLSQQQSGAQEWQNQPPQHHVQQPQHQYPQLGQYPQSYQSHLQQQYHFPWQYSQQVQHYAQQQQQQYSQQYQYTQQPQPYAQQQHPYQPQPVAQVSYAEQPSHDTAADSSHQARPQRSHSSQKGKRTQKK